MAKKKAYRYPLYLMVRAAAGLLALIPRPVMLPVARGLGWLAFYVVLRQRRKTLENLTAAFGGSKTPKEIRAIGREVFCNLAETGADILALGHLTPENFSAMTDTREAEAVYRKVLAEGRGLISLTAHIGNWEFLAAAMAARGFQGGVLARRLYYEPYNRWVVGRRARAGVPTLYRDDSPKKLFRILRDGQVLGLLPDQDIDSLKGIFVPFFGKQAHTIIAPAKLSLATGAPIQTNFLIRTGGGHYRVVLGELIRPEGPADRGEAVEKITRAWMRACEKVIREYPGQWAWMHNRWKTRPPEERGGDVLADDCGQSERILKS